MDLAIRGGPTPRHDRIQSAKGKKTSGGSHYSTPGAPRAGGKPPASKQGHYQVSNKLISLTIIQQNH